MRMNMAISPEALTIIGFKIDWIYLPDKVMSEPLLAMLKKVATTMNPADTMITNPIKNAVTAAKIWGNESLIAIK
jgi:hypothetical protein